MNLEWNKIAASVFLTGTVAMTISLVVNGLYGDQGGHHGEEPKRGYAIEVADVPATGGAPKEEAPVNIALFFEEATVEKGQKLSRACVACHSFEKGGPHKVGPAMWDVVGAAKGHHGDYAYSNAMASFGGEWGYQELSEFLAKPKKYMKGTKMAYAGMKKPEDRAAMILYLRSLSDTPKPLPEVPVVVEEVTEAAPADAVDAVTPSAE